MTNPSTHEPISSISSGVRIAVHAQPGAKTTATAGIHGHSLKIRVQAPPLEGRANEELCRFLAEKLGVPRSQVVLIRGDKSRAKVFEIKGVSLEFARHQLLSDSK